MYKRQVLANDNYDIYCPPSPTTRWVTLPDPDEALDYTLHVGDVVDTAKPSRHDSDKLAARIMTLYEESRQQPGSDRDRSPRKKSGRNK